MVLSDNGKTSRYTYNASGERIVKSHGNMEGVYVNGAPQRIASKIGVGRFNNVYGINGSRVTAGLKDYVARMSQIEAQKEEYYKSLGIAPGVPTMKGSYGDPENTGVGYNSILTELGKHDVPENWIQLPKNDGKCNSTGSGANATPGGPVAWEAPSNPENAQPGYGYVAGDTTELEETFYYQDKKSKQWYVAMDESGEKAYSTGETLVRDFGQTFLEKSSGATDIGSNAYGFLEKMVIPGHKNYFLGINGKYYRHHPNGITGSRVGAIFLN